MRSPLFKIAFRNAFVVSVIYLVTGIGVDAMWRLHPEHWVYRVSLVLDALPARVLAFFGLLRDLRYRHAMGITSNFHLRWIFELTTLAVIYALTLAIAALLTAFERLRTRRAH